MNKTVIFLLLSTCIVILSVAVIAVGPMTNRLVGGETWGFQNCALISDKVKLLKGDITSLKKMKNLCYRQKAMYNMEYTSFIINIILGFICADLAIIIYLGYGKDFEVQTGVIGLVAGVIGFILTLVYVCYSGYIFTKDVAFMGININNNPSFITGNCIEKLYSNGAKYKFVIEDPKIDNTIGNYITEYEADRNDFSNFIRYKDLGRKQYNYNSNYYKNYKNYKDNKPEQFNCKLEPAELEGLEHRTIYKSNNKDCQYLYASPEDKNNNKYVFDRWLAALILACVVLVCNLVLAIFGFLLCSNFGYTNF